MTDRRRNGFHGDPILVEEGPFCKNVSRSASSLKLRLQTERANISWWEDAPVYQIRGAHYGRQSKTLNQICFYFRVSRDDGTIWAASQRNHMWRGSHGFMLNYTVGYTPLSLPIQSLSAFTRSQLVLSHYTLQLLHVFLLSEIKHASWNQSDRDRRC